MRCVLVPFALAAFACVPSMRIESRLAARPNRELRVLEGSGGDLDLGRYRVRRVHWGIRTSVFAGASTSLGGGVTAGLSAYSSWQPVGFTLEGPRPEQTWRGRCERYGDEDGRFAGLSCDVGPADRPVFELEVDRAGGFVSGQDANLVVAMQHAFGGVIVGAHAYGSGDPVAAVRLSADRGLVVAADATPDERLVSTVLAAALFAGRAD